MDIRDLWPMMDQPATANPNMLAQAMRARGLTAAPPSVMLGSYLTQLDPLREAAFKSWVQQNKVPFDPSQNADYDMRGFWRALQQGDPMAQQSLNANDNSTHFPDFWKTPAHESFSNESKYASENAPRWNERDQLVDSKGRVIFDERQRAVIRALFGVQE